MVREDRLRQIEESIARLEKNLEMTRKMVRFMLVVTIFAIIHWLIWG